MSVNVVEPDVSIVAAGAETASVEVSVNAVVVAGADTVVEVEVEVVDSLVDVDGADVDVVVEEVWVVDSDVDSLVVVPVDFVPVDGDASSSSSDLRPLESILVKPELDVNWVKALVSSKLDDKALVSKPVKALVSNDGSALVSSDANALVSREDSSDDMSVPVEPNSVSVPDSESWATTGRTFSSAANVRTATWARV